MLDDNKIIHFQENTAADSTHKPRSQAVCKWNRCTDSFPWLVGCHTFWFRCYLVAFHSVVAQLEQGRWNGIALDWLRMCSCGFLVLLCSEDVFLLYGVARNFVTHVFRMLIAFAFVRVCVCACVCEFVSVLQCTGLKKIVLAVHFVCLATLVAFPVCWPVRG